MGELQEVIFHGGREYVLASSSLADDRIRILKDGDEFAVLDRHGDILRLEESHQGLYWADSRHLSEFVLRLGSKHRKVRPLLLSSRVTKDNTLLAVDLTNPPITTDAGTELRQDTLHIERIKLLWNSVSYETINITNFGEEHARLQLVLEFSADFADIFEVRGQQRPQRGHLLDPQVFDSEVLLAYVGLDDVRRETQLFFSPRPSKLVADSCVYDLSVAPKTQNQIQVAIQCSGESPAKTVLGFPNVLQLATKTAEDARSLTCEIETSNEQFNDWLERSWSDLRMLTTPTEHGLFPYAGTPWFSTPFGRDSLITALQTLTFQPDLARGVLAYLAANQAQGEDTESDAEPGKILHESRKSEMAATGEVPFRQYYGSVDSTPLFVMLAGAYHHSTGDTEFIRSIWPNILRALDWIDRYGDSDGDGFVEYLRQSSIGIRNQGWKDSDDSVFHASGRLAEGRIALVEVQGYVYQAWLQGARLAGIFGDSKRSVQLKRRAETLREEFHEAFWCESIGTYALALDGRKEACCVRTSNPGHCLFTGIVPEPYAGSVERALLDSDIFSGWGVRTLSDREKRYNPMSYHNGTVWPHDNSLIAAGLARYNLKRAASDIMSSLFHASVFFDLHRLPELFCGFPRNGGDGPTHYPVACAPQAWAAGAAFMLLQACLGLRVDGIKGQAHFHHPVLPGYLDELVLKRLRVGEGTVDVHLHRYPGTVGIDVMRREGPISVHMIA